MCWTNWRSAFQIFNLCDIYHHLCFIHDTSRKSTSSLKMTPSWWPMLRTGYWAMQSAGVRVVADPTIALLQWLAQNEGTVPLCHHPHACVHARGEFWRNVQNSKHNPNMSLTCLTYVASAVFSVLPDATDPEFQGLRGYFMSWGDLSLQVT